MGRKMPNKSQNFIWNVVEAKVKLIQKAYCERLIFSVEILFAVICSSTWVLKVMCSMFRKYEPKFYGFLSFWQNSLQSIDESLYQYLCKTTMFYIGKSRKKSRNFNIKWNYEIKSKKNTTTMSSSDNYYFETYT